MDARVLLVSSLLALVISQGAAAVTASAAGVVGDGSPGSCTEAALATALSGGGVVLFDCGSEPHAIILTVEQQIAVDTEIDGGGLVTLSGANATSIFQVFVDAEVLIDDITITRAFGTHGAIENFGTLTIDDSHITDCTATASGGAVVNHGTLTLIDVDVAGNEAGETGAGIANESGTVTITRGSFTDNEVPGNAQSFAGGAIHSAGELTITDTVFELNHAHAGAAIYNTGTLSIANATITGNDTQSGGGGDGGGLNHAGGTGTVTATLFDDNTSITGYGGGVFVAEGAELTITDSTFTRNSAQVGGGLVNQGSTTVARSTFHGNTGYYAALANGVASLTGARALTLTNVTISGNTTDSDNVVYLANQTTNFFTFVTIADNSADLGALEAASTNVEIKNTIIADNLPQDCESPLGSKSAGFNIAGDASCALAGSGDFNSTDPLLGPLGDHGGPTPTQAPDVLGPAVDSGQCIVGIPTDQRGVERPQGLACDMGAVEVSQLTTTTTSTTLPSGSSTTTLGGTTTTSLAGSGCGDPIALVAARSQGSVATTLPHDVTASDALAILNAAVGLFTCELCVCDVDASGMIAATDALTVLRLAVSIPTPLNCPPCE